MCGVSALTLQTPATVDGRLLLCVVAGMYDAPPRGRMQPAVCSVPHHRNGCRGAVGVVSSSSFSENCPLGASSPLSASRVTVSENDTDDCRRRRLLLDESRRSLSADFTDGAVEVPLSDTTRATGMKYGSSSGMLNVARR